MLEYVGGVIDRIILPTANSTNQCVGIRAEYGGSIALTLLATAVIAPIAEEIIFRGFTFRWLQGRLPLWGAVMVSAALFSAAHVGWAEPTLFLPVFLDGLLLAYVFAKSGSVWPGVIDPRQHQHPGHDHRAHRPELLSRRTHGIRGSPRNRRRRPHEGRRRGAAGSSPPATAIAGRGHASRATPWPPAAATASATDSASAGSRPAQVILTAGAVAILKRSPGRAA